MSVGQPVISLSPQQSMPSTLHVPKATFGLRRHAPLVGHDHYQSPSPGRRPSSERSRLSEDDRPYDNLAPGIYTRSADLLSTLTKQPKGAACKKRAAAYALMTSEALEQAVHHALREKAGVTDRVLRLLSCAWRGVSVDDDATIGIREFCRRGGDPATLYKR